MMAASGESSAKRLRVGVDFHTFDGIFQGSRSHLIGLYSEAITQAPDIDFFFFLAQPDALRTAHPEFALPNVRLIAMPHRPGVWRLAWQLAALQRRHAIDLLHLQFRLPLLRSGRCICTVHDVLFETHPQYFSRAFVRMARWSARHAVRRAVFVLTVSDYSRRQIARCYGVDVDRVVLTRNAVDRRRFHPRTAGAPSVAERAVLDRWQLESGEYLCSLGRLEPRKNHRILIEAYARLGPDAPPLLIIGQRDFAYASVFEAIQVLGLGGRIRILEDVDDDSLPVVLRHARLMAYPSQAEGFGMPVLEALASGVPVITSDTTALPEVAGAAAVLLDPTNVGQLTEALHALLNEDEDARRLRIDSGVQQASLFDWRESAANMLAAVRVNR